MRAKASEGEDVNRQLKNEPALKDTPFLFLSGNPATEKKVMTGGFISGYSFLATAVTAGRSRPVCGRNA